LTAPHFHHLDIRADVLAESIADRPDDELIDTPHLASWLGVSTQWLSIGRHKGYGPPFIRVAPLVIRYRIREIRLWLDERIHRRTVEFTGGHGHSEQHRANMLAGHARRRAKREAEATA
jgi:hypothetical protein